MFNLALFFSLLQAPMPEQSFPGLCEDLTTAPSKQGMRLRRVRKSVPTTNTLRVIRAVAQEMGADPELLIAIARHESSLQPGALHILPGDQHAGYETWKDFTYNANLAQKYRTIVEQGPSHRHYASAKSALWRTERYKHNTSWHTTITRDSITANVWMWGYGLYGMQPVLYMGLWDSVSPPWTMCDPRVSTAMLVWALRAQRHQCAQYGEKGTVDQIVARYGMGQCGRRLRSHWDRVLAKARAIGVVTLGTKWPNRSDRSKLLEAIDRRIALLEKSDKKSKTKKVKTQKQNLALVD